jgi:DNA-binding transcriptional MerR regulator
MSLELVNRWLDANLQLTNCEKLIQKYPEDLSLQVEQQEIKKLVAKLKVKCKEMKGCV